MRLLSSDYNFIRWLSDTANKLRQRLVGGTAIPALLTELLSASENARINTVDGMHPHTFKLSNFTGRRLHPDFATVIVAKEGNTTQVATRLSNAMAGLATPRGGYSAYTFSLFLKNNKYVPFMTLIDASNDAAGQDPWTRLGILFYVPSSQASVAARLSDDYEQVGDAIGTIQHSFTPLAVNIFNLILSCFTPESFDMCFDSMNGVFACNTSFDRVRPDYNRVNMGFTQAATPGHGAYTALRSGVLYFTLADYNQAHNEKLGLQNLCGLSLVRRYPAGVALADQDHHISTGGTVPDICHNVISNTYMARCENVAAYRSERVQQVIPLQAAQAQAKFNPQYTEKTMAMLFVKLNKVGAEPAPRILTVPIEGPEFPIDIMIAVKDKTRMNALLPKSALHVSDAGVTETKFDDVVSRAILENPPEEPKKDKNDPGFTTPEPAAPAAGVTNVRPAAAAMTDLTAAIAAIAQTAARTA